MKEILADGVEIYLGDCREILPQLGKVDAVVTDPPYGVGLEHASWGDKALIEWLPAAREVATCVAFTPGIANFTKFPAPTWVIAWLKPNSMGRSCIGFNTWEPILVYGKVSGKKTHDAFTVSVAAQDDTGDHPCLKPLEWAKQIIERVGGETICDPFMGSGTTGVAAVKLGRHFIGIEIEPRYYEIAKRRITEALRQPYMFIEKPKPAVQESLL